MTKELETAISAAEAWSWRTRSTPPTTPDTTRPTPRPCGAWKAAKRAAADYRRAFPDLRVTVEDLMAEGDKAAARLRVRGTHLGELDGIVPTGRRVDFTGIVISRIEGAGSPKTGPTSTIWA